MIQTGFESRVKVQQIIESQLPSFILDENPNASEFLKQYYISQEYQSGPIDIAENLDQYLKLDNLTPEVVVDSSTLSSDINSSETNISVSSTKGFPSKYGLLKIDDEIITYTGISGSTFTGCIRGFSGVTSYHQELNKEELIFSSSSAAQHSSNTSVQNLSSLFLKEFYKKLKYTISPGLENADFTSELNVGSFLSKINDFYSAKGTDDSIRILFNVLYNETPKVINLEDYLLKPSYSDYQKEEVAIIEKISGENPLNLSGQTIKKFNDDSTSAAVSSVEPFVRNLKQFYKLNLFVGNSEFSAIEGNFTITPSTKTTNTSSVSSSVITVDSTIGFPESGTLYIGNNKVTYTNKSVNQFLGCSGIEEEVVKNSLVRNDEIYYGYENGDLTKKVEFRILGVLSDFSSTTENVSVYENDIITLRNLGDNIKNPSEKTYKEIFANSWIYNTSARYKVLSVGSNYLLGSTIDRSSLKVGDRVELLERDTDILVSESNDPHISEISFNTVKIQGTFATVSGKEYDLRRKVNTAYSSGVSIEYGNDKITSDIQNLYSDGDEYAYIASNSLPSGVISGFTYPYRYNITTNIKKSSISSVSSLFDFDGSLWNTIGFSDSAPFLTGDKIYYQPSGEPLSGLSTGTYYVEVLQDNKKIRLYYSQASIDGSSYIKFGSSSPFGTHDFTLFSQRDEEIGVQKIFKKFPLEKNIKSPGEETTPGSTGMLINGVEISNYKSFDKVYYGPLDSIDVLFGGEGYDVINLPLIDISSGVTAAAAQPVISGSIVDISVGEQNYDIEKILSVDISGGNGTGAVIEPIVSRRGRTISFDGRTIENGGGISTTGNRVVFLDDHNLNNGEEIIYNSNGNTEIPIDSAESVKLVNSSSYYVRVENNTTVSLFETLEDYNSNTNIVGFTTGSSGTHKFTTASLKNTISEIKVLDGGSGYTNRKLIVKSSGVSTTTNSINFPNHGFKTGELVDYSFETSGITGLSTSKQYYVLKVDDNSFRLCDAGVGGTSTVDYDSLYYTNLESVGSGYQYFSYPPISVSIRYNPVGFGTSTQTYEEIALTPSVRGRIEQVYVYDGGTGYGSTILNYQKNPTVTIKNGKSASLVPNISNGQIVSVNVNYGGLEYYSSPDLVVYDPTNAGSGAKLKASINNGIITSVKVESTGIGYSSSSTIKVIPAGSNASLRPSVRQLTINANFKYGSELLSQTDVDKLKYSVIGYFDNLRSSFSESADIANPSISGIIGWAYDGNPIYGPFGYADQENTGSITRISSSYVLDTSYVDRPSGFASGFFVEDYKFNNSGDLDEYNGRFGKTPEFPNGVYAYFATIDALGNPSFPYFVGNSYKSKVLEENKTLSQSFDFSSTKLLRNTNPYKVSDENAGYDFIPEIDDIKNQKIVIESVNNGSVESFDIKSSGVDYKVDDLLQFDNNGTNGNGAYAAVSFVKGKNITELNTELVKYENSTFTWLDSEKIKVSILPNHNLSSGDYVTISGFSTTLSTLNDTFKISVESKSAIAISSIASVASIGTTEIYVSTIPNNISIGSSIGIGTETVRVLEIYKNKNAIRVERGLTGVSHDQNSTVTFLPDSFTINAQLEYFKSKLNDKVFFNPTETVGVGTTSGINYLTSYDFAQTIGIQRGIPTKSIYLEGHPFKTNQLISFTANGSPISISTDGLNTLNLPSEVYVVNKNSNLIGIKTTLDSEEVFFHTSGSNNDLYSFEKTNEKVQGTVSKIKTTVSVSTSHGMTLNDVVKLTVNPNLSVGIGTSTSVKVYRNNDTNTILINTIDFSSAGVNTSTDSINIDDHGFNTGDKVYYSSNDVISGLSTGNYYVFKVDSNNIKLCRSYLESLSSPPTNVSFASTGGSSHSISPINPRINSVKNNDLVFDLSDPSLLTYNFKIYKDNEFKDEFVSTGSTDTFNLKYESTIGTVGAALTISYDSNLPEKLYYNLEKSGYISSTDKDVKNYSEINYKQSLYNNEYKIVGTSATTFDIVLETYPEDLSYDSNQCDTLEYITSSKTAEGPISKIKLISGGFGYKKIPSVNTISSTNGKDSYIVPKSNSIGEIKDYRIINEEFEYSFDPTLRPTAFVSPSIVVKDSNTLNEVLVQDGGRGYVESPDLVIVNSATGEEINSGLLTANLLGESISSVNIVNNPTGIPEDSVSIFTVNNSNGITIARVDSDSTGIFTCFITIPPLGYTTDPFAPGDEVFLEGIQKISSEGSGFNSEDYGYKFLVVDSYIQSSPYDKVVFDLSGSSNGGLTTNTGIAKTIQDGFAYIIDKDDYPVFEVVQKRIDFIIGEQLIVDGVSVDLFVSSYDGARLKVSGTYELEEEQSIQGKESSTVATVSNIERNEGIFNVSYSILKSFGWKDDVGKLNLDSQFIPNNDYYQNLSYSIRSSKEYSEVVKVVKPLVHTSGLKDFVDTELSAFDNKFPPQFKTVTGLEETTINYNLFDDVRVDTINSFDFGYDFDIDQATGKTSFIKLINKKLSDYAENIGNEVIAIDDISNQFSFFEDNPLTVLNIQKLDSDSTYDNFIFRITSSDGSEVQLTDVVVLGKGEIRYLLERGSVSNVGITTTLHNPDEKYGEIVIERDEFGDDYLRFEPKDPFDTDYDLKIIRSKFASSSAGIGTTSIGFIDLISSTGILTSGISSSTVISLDNTSFKSLYANIQVIDNITEELNFVELYITSDGSNTYMSEFYADTDIVTFSNTPIGSFDSEITGGSLKLNYFNTESTNVTLRSRIVGFGATSVGVGTYRFKLDRQPDGSERTAIYQSDYVNGVGVSTVFSIDKNLFNATKSIVEVSVGSTKAVHQLMMVFDETDTYLQQSAILSVSGISTFDTALGIGTFTGNISGSNLNVEFHPDAEYSSQNIDISAFTQVFYTDIDISNIPDELEYGNNVELQELAFYNSINGNRINATAFDATSDGTKIFLKSFDPQDTNVLNASTGEFSITNHFFKDGEELIYTPKSSIIGIATIAMTYSNVDSGVNDVLPSTVFAIVSNNNYDKFQISTTRSGTAVTFTDLGGGNVHQFEMKEKNSKSIIVIDNLIQSPLSFSKISHTLSENIGSATTLFNLSGISSINPSDVLKIEDEYIYVTNVGLGTSSVGPISNFGTFNLVETKRGFVGTISTSHTTSTQVDVYRGSYNIVENTLHFVDPPRGNSQIDKTESNLDYATSSFSGRVFLKSDYSSNKVYDDISDSINGIGRTFTLTVGGANTTGIGSTGGNGIILINGLYQQPTTDSNPNGNYIISDSAGITTVTFSGITVPNSDPLEYISSDDDINQNETPRGGIIVSLGSTTGLGFAPLVAADVSLSAFGPLKPIQTLTVNNVGSGYRSPVTVTVYDPTQDAGGDPATVTATVGAGGTLSFSIGAGGTGYNNPQLLIPVPTYENLPVIGVSRLSVGSTTETGIGLSVSLKVEAIPSSGIGSTYFGVTEFDITKTGYSFRKGDVFKPVGLVTDASLGSPISECEFTVLEVYSDKFCAWEFGNVDFIDSISSYQDGVRTIFPLFYNGELLSFETPLDSRINLQNNLLIFINGVLQVPGVNYEYNGGTSFRFTQAPIPEDVISVYFYKGSLGDTIIETGIVETIKKGDIVQLVKNNVYPEVPDQNKRTVTDVTLADKFETTVYSGPGVSTTTRLLNWTKQKVDKKVNGEFVSKSRDSLESLVYPVVNIIGDLSTTDTEIFVDNIDLFDYDSPSSFDAIVINGISTVASGNVESITNFTTIQGQSGAITEISSTSSPNLAIEFTFDTLVGTDLQVGYPIYVFNTLVGNGVTSISFSDSETIGIGTEYLDNVYRVDALDEASGIVTCRVHSASNLSGISTTGTLDYPVGRYSWGRFSNTAGLVRSSNPISIGVTGLTASGLSTYPIIQRRGIGLRQTGSLPKVL